MSKKYLGATAITFSLLFSATVPLPADESRTFKNDSKYDWTITLEKGHPLGEDEKGNMYFTAVKRDGVLRFASPEAGELGERSVKDGKGTKVLLPAGGQLKVEFTHTNRAFHHYFRLENASGEYFTVYTDFFWPLVPITWSSERRKIYNFNQERFPVVLHLDKTNIEDANYAIRKDLWPKWELSRSSGGVMSWELLVDLFFTKYGNLKEGYAGDAPLFGVSAEKLKEIEDKYRPTPQFLLNDEWTGSIEILSNYRPLQVQIKEQEERKAKRNQENANRQRQEHEASKPKPVESKADLAPFFKVLDLDPEKAWTKEEVVKAFNKLAIKYHPDKAQKDKASQEEAKELFLAISEAREKILGFLEANRR